ncbi:MAG TPA: putative sulfate/molybdate transporter [Bacillota bacterium]|nr:putative sulfate/molybdate transporter [Bacillota bacterium]
MEKEKKRINFLGELSGSIGDLGTFLPYILGAISVAGFNPASIFTGFGLFYIFSGWFYNIPMAVQPMKAASAAVLLHNLTPGEVAAAGLITGAALLLLALTGLIEYIGRITPRAVISGIQVGLGLSLAVLGVKMIVTEPLIGWPILLLMLPLLKSRRFPAAIAAVLAGIALNFLLHPGQPLPAISPGIYLPQISLPAAADFNRGFFLAALPQLPLTLANAVLVTTAISRELFGERAARVNNRNLCLTMGAANLIAAPFGGYMMCHGSGGVAAHHRFGGRTKYTAYIIGAFLLAIGLFLGKDGTGIFTLIPEAALGCLLFYSGIDLAAAAKHIGERSEFFVILAVAALSLALNPAVAFIAGFILAKGLEKKWIKI